MLPNTHGASPQQQQHTPHQGFSVGPVDYSASAGASPGGGNGHQHYRRAAGGAGARTAADYRHHEYAKDFDETHHYPQENAIVPMRQDSLSIPMEPRVAVHVHYDYGNSLDIKVPVVSKLVISRHSKHKPLMLHITRKQLQVAVDDQLNVAYPRGTPSGFGHIDAVDTWRLESFKFSSVHVLLDGRSCELPLKITSRTQRFLNDMVAPDLSRTCLIVVGGKQPSPARLQRIDLDMNRDADLLNLIGAYKSEEELWRTEVRAANPGRNVWYGSSEHNPEMVAVNPAGLIHAATARVLGEDKCRKITEYSLDPSGYRTLLLRDAQCGMKWLCDHLFRMCPPQRLDKGMLFSVTPFDAVRKTPRVSSDDGDVQIRGSSSSSSTVASDPDNAHSDEEHESDESDSEVAYDDADRFNMSIYSNEDQQQQKITTDWHEWLSALGDSAQNKKHVLQVTAVAHVSLRMCVHKHSHQDEPRVYCL